MPAKKNSVSYINRMAMRIIYILILVSVTSAIMGFLQVDPSSYLPYLYFLVAMVVLSSFLHKQGGELILDA